MSTNNNNLPEPDGPNDEQGGPGSQRMKPRWIVLVAVYLVVVSAFVLYGLIKLWPYPSPGGELPPDQVAGSQAPTNNQSSGSTAAPGNAQPTGGMTTPPSGSGQPQSQTGGAQRSPKLPDPEKIRFFGGRFEANVFLETRLLLLVMLAGALGSLMHALRSLYWYTGNRMMVWSWVAFYFLLPVTGAMLATIFYFVVRGGFFSSTATFDTTSPFGFAALSALVGLFSPQATLKLKAVAETIFAKPEAGADNKPQESSSPAPAASPKAAPTISSVTPGSGAVNDSVVIAGTGFAEGAEVKFGGVVAVKTALSDTSITVTVPENASATGPVDVEVKNSDGQSVTLPKAFTYAAGAEEAVG